MGVFFWRFAGVPLSYEADSVWLWALRRVHCDAHDFLQRYRCAIAIGVCASFMVGARCKESLSFRPQEKEKARSDERA